MRRICSLRLASRPNFFFEPHRSNPISATGESWAEYQRLVIGELERHNRSLEDLDTRLRNLFTQFALSDRVLTQINNDLDEIRQTADAIKDRLRDLERVHDGEEAIKSEKSNTLTRRDKLLGMVAGIAMLATLVLNQFHSLFGRHP